MPFLDIVCLAGSACIPITSMDAVIGRYRFADRGVIAYKLYIDRGSCIALCSTCDGVRLLGVHATEDAWLRVRGLMLQMCSREEGYAALEGIKQKLLDKHVSEEDAEQSLSTEVQFGYFCMLGFFFIK